MGQRRCQLCRSGPGSFGLFQGVVAALFPCSSWHGDLWLRPSARRHRRFLAPAARAGGLDQQASHFFWPGCARRWSCSHRFPHRGRRCRLIIPFGSWLVGWPRNRSSARPLGRLAIGSSEWLGQSRTGLRPSALGKQVSLGPVWSRAKACKPLHCRPSMVWREMALICSEKLPALCVGNNQSNVMEIIQRKHAGCPPGRLKEERTVSQTLQIVVTKGR